MKIRYFLLTGLLVGIVMYLDAPSLEICGRNYCSIEGAVIAGML